MADGAASPAALVMLYDGVCGFCNAVVQTVLEHDRRGTLRFAALQSEYGQAVTARHVELSGVDSVVWLATSAAGDERVFVRCEAAAQLAAYLGGPWRLLLAAYVVPRPIRDGLYDLMARYRYRLFGRYDRCLVPSAAARARFLDAASPGVPDRTSADGR